MADCCFSITHAQVRPEVSRPEPWSGELKMRKRQSAIIRYTHHLYDPIRFHYHDDHCDDSIPQKMKSSILGRSVKVLGCGLFIDKCRPWLAASPDGIVTDDQGAKWLLEVKCPYKHRDTRVEDACRDPTFCLEIKKEEGQQPDRVRNSLHVFLSDVLSTSLTSSPRLSFPAPVLPSEEVSQLLHADPVPVGSHRSAACWLGCLHLGRNSHCSGELWSSAVGGYPVQIGEVLQGSGPAPPEEEEAGRGSGDDTWTLEVTIQCWLVT